jgi:hypothetical protein
VCLTALLLLIGVASSGFAQDAPELPISSTTVPIASENLQAPSLTEVDAARAAELKAWLDEYADWQEWSARWQNRREPGWLTSYRARRDKPAPPSWLADRCVTVLDESDPLMLSCTRLAEWREDDGSARIRAVRVTTTSQKEAEPKLTWWEHVNLDVLWPAMQWKASVYGVVGMHVTTTVAGRWQVFTAPGVVLLNLPARDGTRVWKAAASYGIGYRLADFNLPGKRPAQLHVNLAKTWMMSDPADAVVGRSIDLLGFSLTFKKR